MFWLVFWLALVCVIGIFVLLAGAAGRKQRKVRQNPWTVGDGSFRTIFGRAAMHGLFSFFSYYL